MRAMFRCVSITQFMYGYEVKLQAVTDGQAEHNQFAQATPGGSLDMMITVPSAARYFEPGSCYFLDFTPAPVGQ